jgi:uncharacterized protein (DUF1697 family)
MATCVALLKGINVGRAKRIAMADLRMLMEGLGCTDVRTLLNSGNVVFDAVRPNLKKLASGIEAAIQRKCGFSSAVVVVTGGDIDAIIHANPLRGIAKDPARHLVAFVRDASVLEEAKGLLAASWTPDAIAVGRRAAYLWCANGLIQSRLMKEFSRVTGEGATARNWATVLKIQAMAVGGKKYT